MTASVGAAVRGGAAAAARRRQQPGAGVHGASAARRASSRAGRGAWLVDVDGNRYVDLVLSWGPLILGHAHPEVLAAIVRGGGRGARPSARRPSSRCGWRSGSIATFPSIEMVRFVSSGTEATMSAVRLARAATGRTAIVKFDGCYHGHADPLLAAAGSGVATLGLPDSPGVTAGDGGATRSSCRSTISPRWRRCSQRRGERDRGGAGGAGGREHGRGPAGPGVSPGTSRRSPAATARCSSSTR